MLRRLAPAVYSVDAGGSRTVVAVSRDGELLGTWVQESFAIASAGEANARTTLESVLRDIRALVGPAAPTVGCIASSSIPVGDEAPQPTQLIDIVAAAAPPGRVVVVNDVVPLVWATGLDGVGIVVCSGTGSSVIGRASNGRLVKVGGHEHILSDQGSGYSIAREGLRAAARDNDGMGPATKLRAEAEAFFGQPLTAVGRWLAELPRPRPVVASFAPCVSASAQDGDAASIEIIDQEMAALAEAVSVATARLGHPSPPIGLAGGVLHGSSYVRARLEAALIHRGLAAEANLQLVDGIAAGARYAEQLTASGSAADAISDVEGLVLEIPD